MKTSIALFGTLLTLTLTDLVLAGRGRCPSTEGMMGMCVEQCSSDGDCEGNNKCCSNGCGHACMAPVTGGGGNGRSDRCKYTKGDWQPCDEATNTMSRTLTLRRGPESCESPKTVTKPCRESRADRCKYRKAPWGECDVTTNTKSRTVTLKKGDPDRCEATKTENKPCNGEGSQSSSCKYKKSKWGDCDVTTNTKSRTLTLKRGDETECEATKTVSKPCGQDKPKRGKKSGKRRNKNKMYSCQYTVANRSECDDVTNTRTMTLTLKKGLPSICDESKTINKPCKIGQADRNGCTYGDPQVSDCVDGEKTVTKALVSGDQTVCEATKTKTRTCGAGGRRKGKKNKRRQQRQNQGDTV